MVGGGGVRELNVREASQQYPVDVQSDYKDEDDDDDATADESFLFSYKCVGVRSVEKKKTK